MFTCWLTYGYFNVFSNNVNKKTNKKALFFGYPFSIEIRTISTIISLKCADFLALAGIVVLGLLAKENLAQPRASPLAATKKFFM